MKTNNRTQSRTHPTQVYYFTDEQSKDQREQTKEHRKCSGVIRSSNPEPTSLKPPRSYIHYVISLCLSTHICEQGHDSNTKFRNF